MSTSKLNGACYCGAITFEVLEPSIWCGHCHCSICQRVHGAGVVTWVGCHEQAVEISDRENSLYWYQSSEDASRGSCSKCGSQMFFRSARWPGQLHITRANFIGDIDREPAGNGHYESHVDWLALSGAPGDNQ